VELGNETTQGISGNPADKHVGTRVCMRRIMLDNNQNELADAPGSPSSQVQKYEKGENRIGASRLVHISTFYKWH
jgi:transcriptional regulator with XRE-family HTH domain